MSERPAKRPTLHALTGMRFLAAGWVVCYHFRSDVKTLFPGTEPAWPLMDAGYAGVDIFFVLSGFIISYTYLHQFSRWSVSRHVRFLWLRLARIYPVHLTALAFFLFYNQSGSVVDVTRTGLWAAVRHPDFREQLLLTHAWGVGETRSWNYPAWSISVEWVAYLCFPFVAVALARVYGTRAAMAGFIGALLLNIGIYLAISAAGENGRIPMLRIVGEFMAGAFLYVLWSGGFMQRFNWRVLNPALVAVAFVFTVAVARESDIAPVLAAPMFAMVILGSAYGRDAFSTFLAQRQMVSLGESSYSLYMTHAVSQAWLWSHLPVADFTSDGRLTRATVLLIYAGVIVSVSLLCYHVIEKPGRDLMRRFVEPRGVSSSGGNPVETLPAAEAR